MNMRLLDTQVEKVHLKEYLHVVLRQKVTFVSTALLVFLAVALYTYFSPPIFESNAALYVKEEKSRAGDMAAMLDKASTPVDSEIEILKSRSNAEKVVAGLHLNWRTDERSPGTDFKILEFISKAQPPVYRVKLLGRGAYEVRGDGGALAGIGSDGVLLRGNGLTLLLKDIKGTRGDAFKLSLLPFNATVKRLRSDIKAVEVGKKTNVISVTYRALDPQLAKAVVNTLIQAHLDQGVSFKAEEGTRTISFIEEQLVGVKSDLEGAERNLQTYQSASGVIQLDVEAQNLLQILTTAEGAKTQATLRRKEVEYALASLKDARKRGAVYTPAVLHDDPLISGMATRLAELQVQKKGLLSDSTEGHPGVRLVDAQIDEVQRKIQATYETFIKAMAKQEEDLTREISRHDANLRGLPVAQRDLARLTRLSKVNADIYTFLLQKHEEARIAKASTISNINVVDPAIAEDVPVSPNRVKNLLLGLCAGLVLGASLCFLREYMDDTMKDPEEMKLALDLPVLALIPFIPPAASTPALVSHFLPRSPAAEAFRALQSGLHFSTTSRETAVTLVTSAVANEGKSTVATNLAITLAKSGAKVLIVDCDLRRPSLHQKLNKARVPGLTEILAGDIRAAAAIETTAVEGLHLVQAGATPPNPAFLLSSQAMSGFIGEMKAIYSNIILDLPPVLAVTDAVAVSAVCDTMVLVLETGRVSAKLAGRAKELLAAATPSIAGIVVSVRSSKSTGYIDDYGYGYGYGYQYLAEEGQQKPWWRRKLRALKLLRRRLFPSKTFTTRNSK